MRDICDGRGVDRAVESYEGVGRGDCDGTIAKPREAPVHPGSVLLEHLEELDMSARELALRIHVPTNRITGILKRKRALTLDTALRLAKFLGEEHGKARYWLSLQQAYDLHYAELDAHREGYLERIRPVAADSDRMRDLSGCFAERAADAGPAR